MADLRDSRDHQDVLEPDRRVALLLGSAGPATPPSLKTRIDALERSQREGRSRRAATIAPRTGWRRVRWAAVPVIAAAIVAALAFAPRSSAPVAATRVADVWRLPATDSAIHPSTRNPAELDVAFHGTPYPAYHDREGWHAAGSRMDEIDGKPAYTVFYETGIRRAAYTVVAGTQVSIPPSASRFVTGGVSLAEFRDGYRWIVVFRNRSNSCVLTAAAPGEREWLVKLAVWRRGRTSAAAS
jgi:hypothetical protein